jgi:hypothetical protein
MRKTPKVEYEFFLGELFQSSDEFSGYIVELMRSAGHVHDFQKLFELLAPADSEDFDEVARDIEDDSLRVLVLNFSASQLRESLKLFSQFSKLSAYSELQKKWPKEQAECARRLMVCVEEFDNRAGLLYSVLKPLRDKTFHYKPEAAREWLRDRLANERQPKPPISLARPAQYYFGPGHDYDEALYSRHLFWGEEHAESLLRAQSEVWSIQREFLRFVRMLTETLLETANISSGRGLDWCLRHRYGFKRVGEGKSRRSD